MNKQFYYKQERDGKTYYDSFNVDMIIRTAVTADNKTIVLLNDGHEDTRPVPIMQGKKQVYQNRKTWIISEILLDEEDAKRLKDLTEIYSHRVGYPEMLQDSYNKAVAFKEEDYKLAGKSTQVLETAEPKVSE